MFARIKNRRRRSAQRGMTLLEIMIVLAILALVMGLVVGPKVMKMFEPMRRRMVFMGWEGQKITRQCLIGAIRALYLAPFPSTLTFQS